MKDRLGECGTVSIVGAGLAVMFAALAVIVAVVQPNAHASSVVRADRYPWGDFAPSWSPDGRKIAFDGNAKGHGSEIYVMNANGSHPHRLTWRPGEFDQNPAWSPDGHAITFEDLTAIYVMNADGRNQRALTKDGTDSSPAWSPDGREIAFVADHFLLGGEQIYVMNADGRHQHRLSDGGTDEAPAWSPDGREIAFTSDAPNGTSEIYVMNADGSHERRLTRTDLNKWSLTGPPDGKRIAFEGEPVSLEGKGTCYPYPEGIYVINADGSHQHLLTRSSVGDHNPAWSPNGRQIAFDTGTACGKHEIHVINADGSRLHKLT